MIKRLFEIISSIFLLCLLGISPLTGQELFQLPEEAPETLFESKIGDADVQLLLFGSWDSSFTYSAGFAFPVEGGDVQSFPFPNMLEGVVFDQAPDLTLSLWFMDRYYFETSFIDDYELNTYLLGYKGQEGETVQDVKVGNTGIGMKPYPYIDIPGAAPESLGAYGRFITESSEHEVLVRFDPSEKDVMRFIGKNQVQEHRISPEQYLEGQFFILPDSNIDFLNVYIEDNNGSITASDGGRFRKADSTDMAYSLTDGWFTLNTASSTRVAVYYQKGGVAVGNASLGAGALAAISANKIDPYGTSTAFNWTAANYLSIDFDVDLQITINGNPCLVLHNPGFFNPFQSYNRYSSGGSSGNKTLRLVKYGTFETKNFGNPIGIGSDNDVLLIRNTDFSLREPGYRYPFASDYPELYGTQRTRSQDFADFEILQMSTTPVDIFQLGENIIPGSLVVYRNGRKEDKFSFDEESGIVSFRTAIFQNDEIEFRFRRYGESSQGGDLIAGTGNYFQLSDEMSLQAAAGLRWNITEGAYSLNPGDFPGSIIGSTAFQYDIENFSLRADAAAGYTVQDTTGNLRLLSMDQSGMTISYDEDEIFPSSPPSGYNQSARGKLYYKDYYSYGVLGREGLNTYSWSIPSSQIYDYASGSKPGPYIVTATEDNKSGSFMAMDFDLNGSPERWIGAQIPVPSEFADFSQFHTLSFSWKRESYSIGTDNGTNFVLELGTLEEDIDGDGILDEEVSAYDTGFSFNDSAHGIALKVGSGPKNAGSFSRESEDANRNKVLDQESSSYAIAPSLSSAATNLNGTGSGWNTESISLTDTNKLSLKNVNALRFSVNTAAGSSNIAGRLLISQITLSGSSFYYTLDNQGTGDFSLQQVYDSGLTSAYSKVKDIFNTGTALQKVLQMSWGQSTALTGAGVTIKAKTTPVPSDQYGSLVIYLKNTTGTGTADISMNFLDSSGKGIKLSNLSLTDDSSWHELKIDLLSSKVYLDENHQSSANISFDSNAGELTIWSLRESAQTSGIIYCDELHMTDPVSSLGFAGSLQTSVKFPGPIIEIGTFPALANASIDMYSSFVSDGMSTLPETSGSGIFNNITHLESDVTNVKTGIDFGISVFNDRNDISGGHFLQFPANPDIFNIRDSFSRDYALYSPGLSRSTEATLKPVESLTFGIEEKAAHSRENLSQNWIFKTDSRTKDFSIRWQLQGIMESSNLSVIESNTAESNYFASWVDSYTLWVPTTEGFLDSRSLKSLFNLSLNSEPVGFDFDLQNTVVAKPLVKGTREHGLKTTFGFPVYSQLGGANWTIRPNYQRQSTWSTKNENRENFLYDTQDYGRTFPGQSWFYTGIPLYEIMGPNNNAFFASPSTNYVSASYNPSLGLDLSRTLYNSRYDLLIPYSADLNLSRLYKRDSDSLTIQNTVKTTLRHFALNQFGLFSPEPIFDFYNTDEFNTSVGYSRTYHIYSPIAQSEFEIFGSAGLYTIETDGFQIENTVVIGFEDLSYVVDEGKISYLWRTESPDIKEIVTIPLPEDRYTFLAHTESIEYTFGSKTQDLDYLPFLVLLAHETALKISDLGYISAYFKTGTARIQDFSLLGFLIGIEAHFIF